MAHWVQDPDNPDRYELVSDPGDSNTLNILIEGVRSNIAAYGPYNPVKVGLLAVAVIWLLKH
jgi:hypothetical protein